MCIESSTNLLPTVVILAVCGVEDMVVLCPKVDEDGDGVGEAGADGVAKDTVYDVLHAGLFLPVVAHLDGGIVLLQEGVVAPQILRGWWPMRLGGSCLAMRLTKF